VGSFGIGCFSFYPTKNMTCGEGGMITTSDEAMAERLRLLRNHGDTGKYNHISLGYNYRMTNLQGPSARYNSVNWTSSTPGESEMLSSSMAT